MTYHVGQASGTDIDGGYTLSGRVSFGFTDEGLTLAVAVSPQSNEVELILGAMTGHIRDTETLATLIEGLSSAYHQMTNRVED